MPVLVRHTSAWIFTEETDGNHSLVLLFDRRAFVTYKNRKEFSFSCPACGAEVNGNSTMSMFQCDYCGMKYSFEDAAEHGYIKIARIIGYEGMLPHQCLPYEEFILVIAAPLMET